MKTVVIGGSSGMGFAIAKQAKAAGHEVVIASRSKEKLERAQKNLGGVAAHSLDVREERSLNAFFAKVQPFDHLVLTAADFIMGPFLKMPLEEAKRFFESKFWGQYSAAKQAAPHIRKGGSIILFAGTAGQKPMMHFAAGCAINAAVEGLTRALALELAPLRVNVIAPGMIHTEVWNNTPNKEAIFQETAKRLPVGRIGSPEDIAQAALFLMQCGYISGSVLYIDGGDRLL